MKNALIFGVTGQDGSYLAQFLLKKGYNVFGTFRRTSHKCFERIEELQIFEDVSKRKLLQQPTHTSTFHPSQQQLKLTSALIII